MDAPIIVVGMHRSGTTLVARILEDMGLFTGKSKESNGEALFFLGINEWLFHQCGATWFRPDPVSELWRKREVLEAAADFVRDWLHSTAVISYTGLLRYLRCGSPDGLAGPWGWKDPRTSCSLPLWAKIYPRARIVHVRRHGVDVAASLSAQQRRICLTARKNVRRRRHLYWLKGGRFQPSETVVDLSLGHSFRLWQFYLEQIERAAQSLDLEFLDLEFEELVARPGDVIPTLSHFCELAPSEKRIAAWSRRIDRGKSLSFKNEPRLVEFAEKMEPVLVRYGYSKSGRIPPATQPQGSR